MGRRKDPEAAFGALPTSFAGATVLVIEDHADSREMMRQMLEALGVRVVLAADGQQALSLFGAEDPDLIFCDLLMPWVDGYMFIERLRSYPHWKTKRIVAVTGLGYESDYQKTWEAGFDGHLLKPIAIETLIETLSRHLPSRDPASGRRARPAQRSSGPAGRPER
jgi:CheY-like chemotaxis protein